MAEPTNGELSRQLAALHTLTMQTANDHARRMDLQGQELIVIREQTFKTNGRVAVAEEKLQTQGRELGEIKKEQSRAAWALFSLLLTVLSGVLVWWLTVGRGTG